MKPKRKIKYLLSMLLVILILGSQLGNDIFRLTEIYANENNDTATEDDDLDWPELNDKIKCKSCILMEKDTGAILYGEDIDKQLYPASITKIMTGLLAIENLDLNDTITFTSAMINALPIDAAAQGVVAGEKMKVKDCLYSLMLRSNNDMAVALAFAVSGSEQEFAKLMTKKAHELGAINTHFANSTGLHDKDHYTTARDMAIITQAAIANPTFASIWGTTNYKLPKTNKHAGQTIWHRHYLLVPGRDFYYEYAVGGKTGYTDEAGRTLVTYARKDGLDLISVIMFSDSDNIPVDTIALLNYGFNNFQKVSINENETRFGQGGGSAISIVSKIYGKETSMLSMGNGSVIIPKNLLLSEIPYKLANVEDTGKGELADITYLYNDNELGSTTIYMNGDSKEEQTDKSSLQKEQKNVEKANLNHIVSVDIKLIIGVIIVIILLVFIIRIVVRNIKRRRIGRRYYTKRHRF